MTSTPQVPAPNLSRRRSHPPYDAIGDHVTTTTTVGGSRARITSLARCGRAVMRGLSDHAHATGDAEARAMGWTTTRTPGLLGLAGRTYRDPRFDTLQRPA